MDESSKKKELELEDPKVISELVSHAVGEGLAVSESQVTGVKLQSPLEESELAEVIAQAGQLYAQNQADLLRRASLGDVVAGITHQSRNIMTGVLSFAQIASHRNTDPKLESLLESIHQESSRCVDLMNQILILARSREANLAGNHSRVLLTATISSACRLTQPRMEARGITLENKIGDTNIELLGDNNALRDLFVNLLQNAADATPAEGLIRLSAQLTEDTVVLQVEDSGPGVALADRENIFAPSFTTKGAGEGTGLGLAVSKQVVAEHKGQITVDESLLGGARFTVTLPRATEQGGPR